MYIEHDEVQVNELGRYIATNRIGSRGCAGHRDAKSRAGSFRRQSQCLLLNAYSRDELLFFMLTSTVFPPVAIDLLWFPEIHSFFKINSMETKNLQRQRTEN